MTNDPNETETEIADADELLSAYEAASESGFDRHTIYNAIASKELVAHVEELGDGRQRYWVKRGDLAAYTQRAKATEISPDVLSITQAMHVLGMKYPVVHRLVGKPNGLEIAEVRYSGRQRRRFVTRASVMALKAQIDAMKAQQAHEE